MVSYQLGWGSCFTMPCFWAPGFLIVILGHSCGARATHLQDSIWGDYGRVTGITLSIAMSNFAATLTCSCSSTGNVTFVTQTVPSGSLLWPLATSFLVVLQRGNEPTKQSSHGSVSYFLRGPTKPGVPCGPALDICLFNSWCSSLIQVPAVDGRACWEPISTPLSKHVQPLVEWLHQWHLWRVYTEGVFQWPSLGWLCL